MHENVVHRVVDEVFTHGIEAPSLQCHEYFRAHAIGTHHQQRLAHPGGDANHPAECAHGTSGKRRTCAGNEPADPRLGVFSGVEIDASGSVLRRRHGAGSAIGTFVRSTN